MSGPGTDTHLASTGGYRLHLGTAAVDALAAVLPAPVWRTLRANGADGEAFQALRVTDIRLACWFECDPMARTAF
ncbi:hypothetical protein [Nostocoides australiense]